MKKLLLISFISILLYSFTTHKAIDQIMFSLKTGNVSALMKHIDQNVQISISNKAEVYTQNQAEAVLRDFFKLHPAKDFQLLHQGNNSGSNFCIGILKTAKGDYRTTFFIKFKDNIEILQEIKFDLQ